MYGISKFTGYRIPDPNGYRIPNLTVHVVINVYIFLNQRVSLIFLILFLIFFYFFDFDLISFDGESSYFYFINKKNFL